ncbi:MAG: ABC transporter substrate-binding protein [Myxococcales bacterium]|nr:ABC transporter substrate-binding protein [Myxococcales bacterium]
MVRFAFVHSFDRLLGTARVMTVLLLLASFPAQAALKVVTTTPDLAALVAEVGGDHVDVITMSRPDQDPHYVDPKPSLVVDLARADMLVFNGLELEIGWLPPLQVNCRNAAVQKGGTGYFDASRYVKVMEANREANRAMGDIHPGGNPHYLYDPREGAKVAIALGAKLAELIPDQRSFLLENAKKTAEKLETMAEREAERFRSLSADQRRVITYHRSLVYVIDWLGLERPMNVEARPGVAPTPSHVARVLNTMRRQKIKTIVQERHYPTTTSNTLARMVKAKVVVYPGGASFADKKELYSQRIQRTAEALYGSLAR